MVSENLRWRLSGGGLAGTGIAAAILSYLRLGAPLASVLFIFVGLAGVLMLLRKVRAYAVALIGVGVLALLSGIVGYSQEGLVVLTILYLALGTVSTIRGTRAYRSI